MVVSLGPGKFYGSSLPRPRIYTDVRLNPERVDPPLPVMDPLLSWAREAHWSMGGVSFQRLRLQGRIEGNVSRLRKQKEKQANLQTSSSPKVLKDLDPNGTNGKKENNKKRAGSISPPPAPMATKRRRFMDLFDEDGEEEGEEEEVVERAEICGGRKAQARTLVGEFNRVAREIEASIKGKIGDAMRVKKRRGALEHCGGSGVGDAVMKVVEEVNRENSEVKNLKGGKMGKISRKIASFAAVNGTRTSPRLAKQRFKLKIFNLSLV